MTHRTVWLASYPKSGNTWMRAIVTSLGVHPHLFGVNQLGSGAQPYAVADAVGRLGLDPRWLDRGELDRLRTALVTLADQSGVDRDPAEGGPAEGGPAEGGPADGGPADGGPAEGDAADGGGGGAAPPRLRKTHERFRHGAPGAEPFPPAATRAAILVVRDPRDVACSFAPFFGVSVDGAIDAMGGRNKRASGSSGKASPVQCRTAQPWGTWSEHTSSWLADDVGFDVHVVRYEDLRVDAVATLAPVFAAIGLTCSTDELEAAVERASFDRLRASEDERGFREVSRSTDRFFRRGEAGGWRDDLTEAQVAAIEADHAEVMQRLGYELTTSEHERAALAESLASRRRQTGRRWTELPSWLGLEVSEGEVPAELPGAEFPRRWLQTTRTATRVQFAGERALLVEDGRRVTVAWPTADDDDVGDLSWLVQGWAVTLSWMQRGNLSLHASTVRIGDEVVAIAGRQGAGKSTTSLALRRRGHQLLVDDTTILTFADGGVFMTPYPRNVHLLPDAAAALGVDFDALPPLAGRVGKSAFLPEDPPPEPQRIDRIVVLTTPPAATDVALDDVRGADRVRALAAHVSRRGLAPVILGPQGFFERLSQLAGATRVQVLSRPREAWTLDEVLAAIEAGAALPLAQDA